MNRLLRYYRTLRYLKFIQIQNRLIRKILKPRVSGKNPPSIGTWNGKWIFCSSPEVFDGESFTFLNHTEAIRSACDWNFCTADKLWLYNLHYFDFLKQEAYRNNPRSIDWNAGSGKIHPAGEMAGNHIRFPCGLSTGLNGFGAGIRSRKRCIQVSWSRCVVWNSHWNIIYLRII